MSGILRRGLEGSNICPTSSSKQTQTNAVSSSLRLSVCAGALCSTSVRPTNRTKRNNQVRLVLSVRARTINNSRAWELGALTQAEVQMHFRLNLPSLLGVVRLVLPRPPLSDPLFSVNRKHKGTFHLCSTLIHY